MQGWKLRAISHFRCSNLRGESSSLLPYVDQLSNVDALQANYETAHLALSAMLAYLVIQTIDYY